MASSDPNQNIVETVGRVKQSGAIHRDWRCSHKTEDFLTNLSCHRRLSCFSGGADELMNLLFGKKQFSSVRRHVFSFMILFMCVSLSFFMAIETMVLVYFHGEISFSTRPA